MNLSGRQLRHPELSQDVGRILQETGLESGSLNLEITEGVLIEDELSDRTPFVVPLTMRVFVRILAARLPSPRTLSG